MRQTLALLIAAIFCGLYHPSQALAQRDLSRRDRLLFYYYNYYVGQQNAQRILRNQKQFQADFNRYRQIEVATIVPTDRIERYVREGRPTATEGIPLPPIYSGRRSFFMSTGQFNPPAGLGR